MKKVELLVTVLAISLSIGGKALADSNTATLADKAGITPDNAILYPIDKAIDNLKIRFASGDDKKAQALVDVAEERLGESEVMSNKGKTDLANQAVNEYNDKITEAQDKIEDAIDEASSSTTDSAIKLDQLKALETAINNKQTYSIEVLKNIENKVSGNAKETIAQVIEMQTIKKEAMTAVAKERQTLLQAKNAVKEAEKSLDLAKKAGDAEAIKAAEDTLAQAQLTLSSENTKFAQVVESKKEVMRGGVGQLKKQAKEDQAKDETTSTNNTATNSTNITGTAPTQGSVTTSTANSTTSTTPTANTDTSTTQGTVTNDTTASNDTKTDITAKDNKGQEMKAYKDIKVKENNSLNGNKSKN